MQIVPIFFRSLLRNEKHYSIFPTFRGGTQQGISDINSKWEKYEQL